jgi:hypothetical protein
LKGENLSEVRVKPEIDRTRGLFVLGNKEANRMGWLLCKVNLGGLGRNRTTDTRIFKTRVVDLPKTAGNCGRLLLRRIFSWWF